MMLRDRLPCTFGVIAARVGTPPWPDRRILVSKGLARSNGALAALLLLVAQLLVTTVPAAAAGNSAKVAGLFDFLFNPPQASAPSQPTGETSARKKTRKRPKKRVVRERSYEPERAMPERAPPERAPPRYVRRSVAIAVAAATPALPKVQPTFFVPVLGDNLAMQLEQGLQEAFTEQPEVAFLHKAKEASGFARDDYYDWVKMAKEIAGSKDRIDIAVMLLGSNDAQALHEGTTTYDLNSDKWKEVYAQRVAAVVKAFKDRNIPLVWVGVPVVRNPRLASQMAIINDMVRTEVTKGGATFIDSWQAFVNDRGNYDDYGPDATGQRVKLRAADGLHFTRAGARKLALFVEPDIRRAMEKSKPAVDALETPSGGPISDADLPPQPTVDINELIRRALVADARKSGAKPGAPAPLIEARLPVPAPPLEPVLPSKPAAGPVMPLTAPPTSPGGELAQRVEKATVPEKVSKVVERALVIGLPVDARPGRSDDFRWPQP